MCIHLYLSFHLSHFSLELTHSFTYSLSLQQSSKTREFVNSRLIEVHYYHYRQTQSIIRTNVAASSSSYSYSHFATPSFLLLLLLLHFFFFSSSLSRRCAALSPSSI